MIRYFLTLRKNKNSITAMMLQLRATLQRGVQRPSFQGEREQDPNHGLPELLKTSQGMLSPTNGSVDRCR